MKTEQRYTFGETDRAAERLERLAQVFWPSLVELLMRAAPPNARYGCALDLGSGPGHTTATLCEVLNAESVVGLERSTRFVELARSRAQAGASFVVHDVTDLPFPVPLADFAFSRFLLTHLAKPHEVVGRWAAALRPGGHLVLQETAEMSSNDDALTRYYELVGQLQTHYGQELHIGRELPKLVDPSVYRVVDFRITEVPLRAARMARLHHMNLETWRTDAFARAHFDSGELDSLGVALSEVAQGKRHAEVHYCLGELILERRSVAEEPRVE
jgi:SAM-dependent methyltransferase